MDFKRLLPQHYSTIGFLGHPHGLKGEINMQLDDGVTLSAGEFVFVGIDNTMIPYEIESLRPRGDDAMLVKFKGVDSQAQSAGLKNKELFLDSELLDDDEVDAEGVIYLHDMVGFDVWSEEGVDIGIVDGYDDTTTNLLLIVSTSSGNVMIPFVEDYIRSVDRETKRIIVSLPDGFKDVFTF